MFQRVLAILLLLFSLPILLLIIFIVKLTTQSDILFFQKRTGKNKKQFTIYKIQTMIPFAEKIQNKFSHLNEADGPVFKIKDDPRYTKIGKLLSKTGLDELPQLINIIKGEMAFIGPRPLLTHEAEQIPKQYGLRFSVLPGITSLWVIKGSHKLSFKEWMELDIFYIKNKSVLLDLLIGLNTIKLLLKATFKLIKRR